ncbi:MAG: glycosyltransferase family 2 protein [Actinomycetota bacterium]
MTAIATPDTNTVPVGTATPETISVIICAYTDERWADIAQGIESLRTQTLRPQQIVLVIDHNDELLERAADEWASTDDHGMRIDVVANTMTRGLSGARNTGVTWCDGDIIAFLDDDARAGDDGWIEAMVAAYGDPDIAGVGGGATPNWDGVDAPEWFPREFGWVIGCSYTGMPTEAEEVRNFIGCNMSFRREVFESIGFFTDGIGRVGKKPVGCEETEYCIRLRQRHPEARLIFDPRLDVFHRVSPDRREFTYFRSRCWSEGLSKAVVTRNVGAQDGLEAERAYTTKVLPMGVMRGIGQGLTGKVVGFQRAGAIVLGLVWTAAGYVRGRIARSTSV